MIKHENTIQLSELLYFSIQYYYIFVHWLPFGIVNNYVISIDQYIDIDDCIICINIILRFVLIKSQFIYLLLKILSINLRICFLIL